MKKIIIHGLLMLMATFSAGCSRIPFERTSLVDTHAVALESLLESHWLLDSGVYRVRQSGLFRLGWKKLPLEGFAQIDTGRKTVRLVALNGMGLKLFDLLISREEVTTYHLMPQFEKHPRFAEAVAASVRRIFLDPQPDPGDELFRQKDRYIVSRDEEGRDYRFVFGGREEVLLETEGAGQGEDWRVRYFEYRRMEDRWVPVGIVLEDDAAGYRLTLWLEGIKKVDG